VLPSGEEVPVETLMGLIFRDSVCGDGACGTGENYGNCPIDCPSGSRDGYCDGVEDRVCDPECVEEGGPDSDCPGLFVDIKPGSCPNPLNLRKAGVVPVALLGTAGLDVQQIDPRTIRISRDGFSRSVAPIRWKYNDVATPNPAGACNCWEAPGDRRTDIVLHFEARALEKVLKLCTLRGRTVSLKVTAKLRNGTQVTGRDCVRLSKW